MHEETAYGGPTIHPESRALLYRIVDDEGTWGLVREHPDAPRTLVETLLVSGAHNVFPTDETGRFIVPDATRDYLTVEPGDVVSLFVIVEAQATVALNGLYDAGQPVLESLASKLAGTLRGLTERYHSGMVTRGGEAEYK